MEIKNFKKEPKFKLLDLSYIKHVSRNDLVYQRGVTKIFIKSIPENLKELHAALQHKSYADLYRILHHMKSNLSIMGLDQTLNKYFTEELCLDLNIQKLNEDINFITSVCNVAVEEAKEYLKVIA